MDKIFDDDIPFKKFFKMSNIRWENVPESEVRAEVEAVLESQGESKKIRQFLLESSEVNEWRNQIIDICKKIIEEKKIDNLTPDIIYDQIAATARDSFPTSVQEEIKTRLVTFLNNQFEDHI